MSTTPRMHQPNTLRAPSKAPPTVFELEPSNATPVPHGSSSPASFVPKTHPSTRFEPPPANVTAPFRPCSSDRKLVTEMARRTDCPAVMRTILSCVSSPLTLMSGRPANPGCDVPSIVTGSVTSGSIDSRTIDCAPVPIAKSISSGPSLALAISIASRSVPGPESSADVTVNVAAGEDRRTCGSEAPATSRTSSSIASPLSRIRVAAGSAGRADTADEATRTVAGSVGRGLGPARTRRLRPTTTSVVDSSSTSTSPYIAPSIAPIRTRRAGAGRSIVSGSARSVPSGPSKTSSRAPASSDSATTRSARPSARLTSPDAIAVTRPGTASVRVAFRTPRPFPVRTSIACVP